MKKNALLLVALMATCVLAACGSQAKQDAAQAYCDSTNWTLTTSGNLYVCSYADGSICEAEDFRTASCPENPGDTGLDYEQARANVDSEEKRISACEEKSLFYLNINEADFTWEDESESGASFARNGHVVFTKQDWTAEEDVFCFIDMVDGNVSIELDNHIFLGVTYNESDTNEELLIKWESEVNNGVALENDECTTYVFTSKEWDKKYWAYICHQPSTEEGYTDTDRSGIYDIFGDTWVLTCTEANGAQGVGYDEEVYGAYNNDKTCAELENYIAELL